MQDITTMLGACIHETVCLEGKVKDFKANMPETTQTCDSMVFALIAITSLKERTKILP